MFFSLVYSPKAKVRGSKGRAIYWAVDSQVTYTTLYGPYCIHFARNIIYNLYLYRHLKKNIINQIFVKASNALFNNNLVTRKSIKCYLFTLFKKLVNWQSIKQKLVIKLSIKVKLLILLYVIA